MAAEMFSSALVSLLVEKAADPILRQFGAMWGIQDKLDKLRRALLSVQSQLDDAEERQVKNKAVGLWLAALKGAAYDAEDILDEFNTQVLRCKAEIQNDMMNKVRDFFSSRNPVLFRCVMGNKLKDIAERIDDLYAESAKFNFKDSTETQTRDRPQTHSYVVGSEVIGREHEKEEVVKLLLDRHEEKNVTVLPIIGMGGLGKTTFAQFVYNDERVQTHFQLHMWVCVSDIFDIAEVAKKIVVSATGSESDVPTAMDLLQRRLREVLSKKRYLLVLDDVWNEDQDKWEGLKSLINCGIEHGSVVVVTTRSERVSSIMGTHPAFTLSCFSEDDSWDLFEKRAFAVGAEPRPQLEAIGKEIVKKCSGLPLAIKTVGSLMRTKSEVREWLAVMRSEIWDMPAGEDGILAPLKLSYRDMPSYVRQCFAFCAVFPKDHEMEKDVLIQLWVAQGFIPSEGNVELEVKGHEIFNELIWRSFFQDIQPMEKAKFPELPKYGYSGKTTCKMHDLMHDLARSIMKDECLAMLEPAHLEDTLSENVRHLSIHFTSPLDVQRVLNKFPTIRTLLSAETLGKILKQTSDLSKPMSLRALRLNGPDCMQLPQSIARLIHLRYLDLSHTSIETLPESISMLYNLQTLRLSGCERLSKLPEDMRCMSSLRHVYLDGCKNLKRMPAGIGQLSCLQTLTKYIVCSEAGGTITELKCLDLCGALQLYNLKNVRNPGDAKEANMSSKQNLHSLAFCWGVSEWNPDGPFNEDDEFQAENSEEVLEALKPHTCLKMLVLRGYRGVRFPTWMMDFPQLQNMVEIHLAGCIHCEKLPPLWQLPCLEVLCLRKLDAIEHICSNTIDGARSKSPFQAFPSLKRLVLEHMQNLEAWWEGEGRGEEAPLFFPQLVQLSINYCPQLTSLPRLPPLQGLEIFGSDRVPLEQISCLTTLSNLSISSFRRIQSPLPHQEAMSFKQLKSVKSLNMSGCGEFAPLLEDEDEALALSTSLQYLYITCCNWMFSSQLMPAPFGLWKHLISLQSLFISCSDNLVYWPEEELRGLSSLTRLRIAECKNLTDRSQSPSSASEGSTPPLEDLVLVDCDGLVEFPKCPASVVLLSISGCQNLKSLGEEGLRHLTALRHININGCSNLTTLAEGMRGLTALETLRIQRCPRLTSLCKEMQGLTALFLVGIIECPQLTSLPEGMQGLTALNLLLIVECPQLTSLPDGLRQQLPSTETLWIIGCPELERRCRRGGAYWDDISLVPARRIGREQDEQGPNCCTLLSLWSQRVHQRLPA